MENQTPTIDPTEDTRRKLLSALQALSPTEKKELPSKEGKTANDVVVPINPPFVNIHMTEVISSGEGISSLTGKTVKEIEEKKDTSIFEPTVEVKGSPTEKGSINRKNFVPTKSSIMDDVEKETKDANIAPKLTVSLAMTRALRIQIETAAETIQNKAYKLIVADWILFLIISLCMLLISMGIDVQVTTSLGLTRILAPIALAIKTFERGLDLTTSVKEHQSCAKELRNLIQKISVLEFNLYLQGDSVNEENNVKIEEQIQDIWVQFNNTELKTLLAPPRLDPTKS